MAGKILQRASEGKQKKISWSRDASGKKKKISPRFFFRAIKLGAILDLQVA